MKFSLVKNVKPTDVSIAYIRSKELHSEDILFLNNNASLYDDNNIAITKTIETSCSDRESGYALGMYCQFQNILLTDEFHYNKVTGTKTPLWYQHTFPLNFKTKNTQKRSLKRIVNNPEDIKESIIRNLISTNSNSIIAEGTIKVNITRNNVTTEISNYYISYGDGSIYINEPLQSNDTIYVEYLLVENTITIEENPQSIFRIHLSKLSPYSDEYYNLIIYSTTKEPFKVKYNTGELYGSTREVSAWSICSPIFNEITEQTRQYLIDMGIKSKVFSRKKLHISEQTSTIMKEFIMLTDNTKGKSYFFTNNLENNKIYATIPINKRYNEPWYLQVKSGTFEHNGIIYNIPKSEIRYLRISEQAIYINRNTIGCNYPIIAPINNQNKYDVTVVQEGRNIDIEYINFENNTIKLKENISNSYDVIVTYRTINDFYIFTQYTLNSIQHSQNDTNPRHYIYGIFLCPYINSDNVNFITLLPLPKYTNKGYKEYTSEDFNKIVNIDMKRDDLIGLSTVNSIQSPNSADLLLIGTIYLSNPYDSDAYLVEDARIYGGGVNIKRRNYYDYNYYDGEIIDMSLWYDIYIKKYIYDDLVARVKEYSRDAILNSTNDEELSILARNEANEIIKEQVRKHMPLGTKWRIFIERDRDNKEFSELN